MKRLLLRAAALPVTDRRWAAPLCATALGFGLFAGVAIGPGATGTLAGGVPQVIEMPGLLATGGGDGEGEGRPGGGGEEDDAFAQSEPEGGGEAVFPEASNSTLEAGFPEPEAPASPIAEPAPPSAEEPSEEGTEPEEPAQLLAGFVVHANPAAGSYTVVEAGGLMNAIHATKLPAPGAKVSVPVRTLANGTYAEDGKRKQDGRRTSATIAGVVTFVEPDPAAPAYAVSKRGVSVLVRVHPDPSGAAPALPQLGAYAMVAVDIEKVPSTGLVLPPPPSSPPPSVPAAEIAPAPVPACGPDPAQSFAIPTATAVLWQSSIDADGAPFASSDFAGVVTALCPAEAKLALSADDLRQSGKDIVFTMPPSIDLAGFELGDSVVATATIEPGGALTLTGLAGDERTKGADDAGTAQGDLVSHKPR